MERQHRTHRRAAIPDRWDECAVRAHPGPSIEVVVECVIDVDSFIDGVARVLDVLHRSCVVEPRRIQPSAHPRLIGESVGAVPTNHSHRDAATDTSCYRRAIVPTMQVNANLFRLAAGETPREVWWVISRSQHDIDQAFARPRHRQVVICVSPMDVSDRPQLLVVAVRRAA